MANLDLIKKLNNRYDKNSPVVNETKLFAINEALDPDKLEKALPDYLASMGPAYVNYFELGTETEVALLFIDVCGFSTRYAHYTGEQIAEYFDAYYDVVIPIIYKYGGEIDKIMGDGIICVFGKPFLSGDILDFCERASNCAKEIITVTADTAFSSKVAFHCGQIRYFKNKTGLYKEYTMVGKPLTELFRLESISHNDRINYFDDTIIRTLYEISILAAEVKATVASVTWLHQKHVVSGVKGIAFERFYSIRKSK